MTWYLYFLLIIKSKPKSVFFESISPLKIPFLNKLIIIIIDSIKRENGKVELSLIDAEKFALIHIKDNGVGILKKDWKNIFRPGFSTKQTGWGLGLSLSSRIVEEIHGGSLKVIRSSATTGTILEISL